MKKLDPQTRYIFVSGGVMSAVGKGVTAASISLLLKKHGFTVCPVKCENNLNVDFGTINPIEHGDPFLCHDGLEADIDLGNYERFLDQKVGFANFMTMGQLYQKVINNERSMKYEGEDVEPIPHVVDEIIRRIKEAAQNSRADFVVIELGGTVGEYENNNGLYYEAARIMAMTESVVNVHVTYVPVPPHIGEPKTKPAQFGIKALMSMGIVPNFIVIRSELPTDSHRKYKFALKLHIPAVNIISCENLDSVYKVPAHLHSQNLDHLILQYFGLKGKKQIDLSSFKQYTDKLQKNFNKSTTIAIVGKYFSTGNSSLIDSYYALIESIRHASIFNNTNLKLKFINSDKQENSIYEDLQGVTGIIVPIGWGKRGVAGKIKAITFARTKKIPYLGLCYGMQLAAIEFARNVASIKDADTEENNPKGKNLIIHSIPFNKKYQTIKGDGTSMRLGSFDCIIRPNTLIESIINKHQAWKNESKRIITERHRHRFEFNNAYRDILEKKGLVISGTSPDNFFVENIELLKAIHPFFLGTQGHPEYESTPQKPHPIFIEFIKATIT
ncbi:MAG: CTP synthase [bacterium]